ncbi:helix-turn-helix domain-containing protein [Streptomyces spinosisporus]|uniref:Helix-turn-helix domain-containing protein n=1 Tax=Streptomyces spinosisporus TaxID=2927582 RepID=A0ABS9XWM4_9ACTN|nr:helix-turn-helix domain-containing protein [Streptomyces spinosisporus]MCI3246484.1 helix-turn-helix domain-containing protein [Streptomyces spinosisporus]
MTRRCRIDDCTHEARTGRRICGMHRQRIWRHGDPNFTEWTVADEQDVQTIIREARPAPGLTRLERIQVAQGLTQHGLPAQEIARILDVTPRTVYRWRSEGFRQAA